MFFSKPEDSGLHGCERAIDLPALEPPMRGTFRCPLWPAREIAPAAACDQYVQQRIHDLAKGGMRHPPPAWHYLWGKDVGKELPFQVAQALESASHNPLLHGFKGL
jgi:hypothetical protein